MGLFQNLFGREDKETRKDEKTIPWIKLTSLDQFSALRENSNNRTQLIFKHSTTCGISRMVLKMFTDGYALSESQADLYFLDLHQYRNISSAVAQELGVQHQSPQLIVLKNGTVVTHASHGSIPDVALEKYV
ncbi:bacillithiol system redox-active protein YtxJ [Arenibacter sp. GZD96]|uniref:bacillithiol system redox-active protein YtxJ n=1 Tax=Aurantibrevibacter litoralis TaxID=3106030 RepID=UPI002AFF5576|nr:bacillithiol system redox-active protein YtxJ [Arenibacter sp. GZD-96]MEA1787355.1 bacillithiol system redox-active protein YtxJ [Arenibacter sp. GZD-96]